VIATEASSVHQGEVALVFKDSRYWQIESVRKHGPNVISCELVTGRRRVPIVGVYIPPNDLTTCAYLSRALGRFPKGNAVVLGDLNVNLQSPRDARDTEIVGILSTYGLEDMMPHFKSRHAFRHGNTWSMVRDGVPMGSRCDYAEIAACLRTCRSRTQGASAQIILWSGHGCCLLLYGVTAATCRVGSNFHCGSALSGRKRELMLCFRH
jgi:hypothetical protein